jgi:hypothetical protein
MRKISEKSLNRTRKENGGKQGGKKNQPRNIMYTTHVKPIMP